MLYEAVFAVPTK